MLDAIRGTIILGKFSENSHFFFEIEQPLVSTQGKIEVQDEDTVLLESTRTVIEVFKILKNSI